MYTAFLALPPLDSQIDTTEPETTPVPETILPTPPAISELSTAAAKTVNSSVNELNRTLLSNDTVRYVVVPAMFGGLGSVALRLIQEGGSFMAAANAQAIETQDGEELTAQTESEGEEQGSQENLGQTELGVETQDDNASDIQESQTITEEAIVHDFVPSIQMGAGLEFSILVTSSVLLGAVVGFIGTILSLDGPPEHANNKSKLAATALMFALFFPSVITVFQENAMSQAQLIKADNERNVLEEQVREKTQQAENLEDVAHDQIINEIELLGSDSTYLEPSPLHGQSSPQQVEPLAPNTIIDSQTALIDSTKSLVLNATSEEKAKEFITSIFKIGNIDNGDVREYAIRALREVAENPTLSEAVQQTAAEKAEELETSE
ncbi:hypothetical protein [Leptolyngbya sp. Heron Island J]|uniref:hypothetical protein n=1 Tax=Leptolyngbya sp. Heron Island J TaxID=1385935 RepID=UPI0004CF5E8C|nr:hypothetical protein [Leptolyngbya sp. Heron Island J]